MLTNFCDVRRSGARSDPRRLRFPVKELRLNCPGSCLALRKPENPSVSLPSSHPVVLDYKLPSIRLSPHTFFLIKRTS